MCSSDLKGGGVALSPITNGPVVDHRMQTEKEGIFACGNVLHVNDLVDNVSTESTIAGKYAADYANGKWKKEQVITMCPGSNVRYLAPQKFAGKGFDPGDKKATFYFRVSQPTKNVEIVVRDGDKVLSKKKKQYVNPGEIENVSLTYDELQGCKSGSVTVECINL